MKIVLLFIIELLYFSCLDTAKKLNLELIESQTLCIFWSQSLQNRDTFPAILFTLRINTINEHHTPPIKLLSNIGEFQLKYFKTVQSNDTIKLGYKLESFQLFPYFKEDFSINTDLCYQDSLVSLVQNSKMFFYYDGDSSEIRRSSEYKNVIGLK